jgi:hypothetical protein
MIEIREKAKTELCTTNEGWILMGNDGTRELLQQLMGHGLGERVWGKLPFFGGRSEGKRTALAKGESIE